MTLFSSTRLRVLSTSVLLGFSSLTHAHAATAPEIFFYPAGKWDMEIIEGEKAGATIQQCKFEAEFNNGYTVQLNGSHRWVETLNINFMQDAFEDGGNYNVSLTVPGLNHKTLKGKAKNNSVLSIDMQGHKDFYQAMRNSSVLDMQIDENHFRFYLVGFSNVANDFERCMAGGEMDAPAQSATSNSDESNIQIAENDEQTSSPTINETIALEEKEINKVPVEPVLPPKKVKQDTSNKAEEKQPTENVAPSKPSTNPPVPPTQVARKDINEPYSPPNADRSRYTEALAREMEKQGVLNPLAEDSHIDVSDIKATQQPTEEAQPLIPSADAIMKASPEKDDTLSNIPPETVKNVEPVPTELPKTENKEVAEKEQKVVTPGATALLDQPVKPTHELLPKFQPVVKKSVQKAEADFTKVGLEDTMTDDEAAKASPATGSEKINQMEKEIALLKAQNEQLNNTIKATVDSTRQQQLDVSSDNWNLEQATKQYHEADRQLKRLGQQLQQERAQCKVEKDELEMMLFDPKLTEEKQMAKLVKLQKDLEAAQRRISELEGR